MEKDFELVAEAVALVRDRIREAVLKTLGTDVANVTEDVDMEEF
jgi:hypothetical protein